MRMEGYLLVIEYTCITIFKVQCRKILTSHYFLITEAGNMDRQMERLLETQRIACNMVFSLPLGVLKTKSGTSSQNEDNSFDITGKSGAEIIRLMLLAVTKYKGRRADLIIFVKDNFISF